MMTAVESRTTALESLSLALLVAPPTTLTELADLLADQLGGSVVFWTRTAAGWYEPAVIAGDTTTQPPATLPARLPMPSTPPYIYADLAALPWRETMLLTLRDQQWRITFSSMAQPIGGIAILHALLEGWFSRLTTTSSQHDALASENVLAHSRLLQSIIDASPAGIVVGLAPDGRLVLANAMAETLWGHPLLAVNMDEYTQFGLFHADGQPFLPQETGIAIVLRTGQPVMGQEVLLRRPDGSAVPVLANTSPITASDGTLVGAVVVFQDISAWKQQEQDRDDAIATIAHDLKNPLTTIRGSADMMLRRSQKEVRSERDLARLNAIMTQADRMGDFLGLLVDVQRLHSGDLSLSREPTDLHALIGTVVDAMNGATPYPRIDYQATPVPSLRLDPIWMERVVRNLLDNALKYSPADTSITASLSTTATEVVWTIRDQGIGLEPQDLERIFERFTRGRNSVGRISGTGLGLYTVRAVVQAHGGIIRAESAGPERGSQFIMSLPL